MSDKEHAHELIERLQPAQIEIVVGLLQRMVEKEPVTDEDRRRFQEAQAVFSSGKGVPMGDVLADFGL